jgi:hypothetical protein
VHKVGREHLEIFLSSRALAQFRDSGNMISGVRIDNSAIPESIKLNVGLSDWLEHPKIPFMSYPHEWPASVLHDAALLTLKLARELHKEGILLKDAAADNLTIKNGKLVFLDALSFEKRPEKSYLWMAAAQFERAFIIPLLVYRLCQVPINFSFSQALDGLDPKDVIGMFSGLKRFNSLVLKHVILPVLLGNKMSPSRGYKLPTAQSENKAYFVFNHMLNRLDSSVKKLKPKISGESTWSDYTNTHSYTDQAFQKKVAFIRKVAADSQGNIVLDVGCNDGFFSKIFLENGASVIAIDGDPMVVDRLWQETREQGLDIIPLVQNISSPSPGMGWRNFEKPSFLNRVCGIPHTAIFLAVIHHMMVTDGVPLDEIIDLIADLVVSEAVIEFIPTNDIMFQRICRGRESLYTWYNKEVFEASCKRRFKIIEECSLVPSSRQLYRLRRVN